MTSNCTQEQFLEKCKKVEKICKEKKACPPDEIIKQIAKDIPNFIENCNEYYQKSNPQKNLRNFNRVIRKIEKQQSKDENNRIPMFKFGVLGLDDDDKSDVELSFDNEDHPGESKDEVEIAFDPKNSKEQSYLYKELVQLKKREFGMLKKISDLEQKLSLIMLENSNHIRKTYEIQNELISRSKFDSPILLQLHPVIESKIELKIYFWALYRRLSFFAIIFDLFRKRFIRVKESVRVNIKG